MAFQQEKCSYCNSVEKRRNAANTGMKLRSLGQQPINDKERTRRECRATLYKAIRNKNRKTKQEIMLMLSKHV